MMKIFTHVLPMICIVILLVCALFSAGCTSMPASEKSMTPTVSTTVISNTSELPSSQSTTTTSAAATANVPTITVSLPSDITITYPSDWEKEEPGTTSLREYGRTTTNIVNFFSPDITWERAHGIPNHDTSRFTTFSIDVDTQTHSDEDRYFNLATVAIQDSLGSIEITRHEQLPLFRGISGYKTYALEFNTVDKKWHYRFVNVDGRFVIISVKNPLPYSTEVDDMLASIKITPDNTNKKSR